MRYFWTGASSSDFNDPGNYRLTSLTGPHPTHGPTANDDVVIVGSETATSPLVITATSTATASTLTLSGSFSFTGVFLFNSATITGGTTTINGALAGTVTIGDGTGTTTVRLNQGSLGSANGTVTISTGSIVTGQGGLDGLVHDNGLIEASGAFSADAIDGTGRLVLAGDSSLSFSGACTLPEIELVGTGHALTFAVPSSSILVGVAVGDTLGFTGVRDGLQIARDANGDTTLTVTGSSQAAGTVTLDPTTSANYMLLTSSSNLTGSVVLVLPPLSGGRIDPVAGAAHQFEWQGGASGDWRLAANWFDDTENATASRIPGAQDSVFIGGTSTGLPLIITGSGAAGDLVVQSNVIFDGTFQAQTLTDDDPSTIGTIRLAAGSSLAVGGDAAVSANLILAGPGATLSVDGNASFSGALTLNGPDTDVTVGGLLAAQSVTVADGSGIVAASASLPGTVTLSANSTFVLGDPTQEPAKLGMITIEPGTKVVNPGGAPVTYWNDGVIEVTSSNGIGNNIVDGSGTILVDAGVSDTDGQYSGSFYGPTPGPDQIVRFNGPNAAFFGSRAIENFKQSDILLFVDSAQYAPPLVLTLTSTATGSTLSVDDNPSSMMRHVHFEFDFDEDYTKEGLTFALSSELDPYRLNFIYELTLVNATPCFCPGTLISTPRGQRPVETLRIGDLVRTADGGRRRVLWIGRRSYTERFVATHASLLPVRIRAGALGAGLPERDLLVSPRHAMLVRGALVPAELLVNGRSVVREEINGDVHYLHVELEDHALLLAEGAATESFVDDNSREMFQNAAEYHALYPDRPHRTPNWCVPRVEDGELLVEARRFVETLAGLPAPEAGGTLRGRLDRVENNVVHGWAWSPEQPEAPVLLEILADGVPVSQVLADRFRADLADAGVGTGCHAFAIRIPDGSERVTVRRARDGVRLAA